MHLFLEIVAWLIAVAWLTRTLGAWRGIPAIPDLGLPQFDVVPANDAARITVVVPARNEQQDIAATLESLLAQDYPNLIIVAVDDRSTDATGSIMQGLAAANPLKLRVVTVTELPPGWLGKTHAMASAARVAIAELATDYLLFTDGDVYFRPDAIRRALAGVVASDADHFVLFPTAIIRRWDEAALLSLFQFLGIWATRPWRSDASRSLRDSIGIGAFNLLKTSAYLHVGGFEALRMAIVEDLALARLVKQARLKQRFAFGRGLICLHWAAGMTGLIDVMTKNIFAVFQYRIVVLLLACGTLLLCCACPFVAIFFPGFRLASAVTILSLVGGYTLLAPRTGIPAWNIVFTPLAALAMAFAQLRSMYYTLRQGGVIWRGTFYPLAELRRSLPPLFPRTR